jgi:hypothetical protein
MYWEVEMDLGRLKNLKKMHKSYLKLGNFLGFTDVALNAGHLSPYLVPMS